MTNEEKITSVLERLPVLEERRSRIGDRANRIAVVFEWSVFKERPAARSTSEKTAIVEVDKLASLAIGFANHVDRMHRNSLAVFEGGDCGHPRALAEQLWKLASVAAKTPPQPRDKKPRKARAAETAKQALIAYEFLTGVKATIRVRALDGVAYGPYLTFLTELFEALEINASAENWGREATKAARRKGRQ